MNFIKQILKCTLYFVIRINRNKLSKHVFTLKIQSLKVWIHDKVMFSSKVAYIFFCSIRDI